MPRFADRGVVATLSVAALEDTLHDQLRLTMGKQHKQDSAAIEAALERGRELQEQTIRTAAYEDGVSLIGPAKTMPLVMSIASNASTRDTSSSPAPASEDSEALALSIRLTAPLRFYSIANKRKKVPRDVKIEVYVNGGLFEVVQRPCFISQKERINEVDDNIFTGLRVHRQIEKPLVYQAGQHEAGMSHDERWQAISQALLHNVQEKGRNTAGDRQISSEYLVALAQLDLPEALREHCSNFGVIDVVITIGDGQKASAKGIYLKAPTHPTDPAFSLGRSGSTDFEASIHAAIASSNAKSAVPTNMLSNFDIFDSLTCPAKPIEQSKPSISSRRSALDLQYLAESALNHESGRQAPICSSDSPLWDMSSQPSSDTGQAGMEARAESISTDEAGESHESQLSVHADSLQCIDPALLTLHNLDPSSRKTSTWGSPGADDECESISSSPDESFTHSPLKHNMAGSGLGISHQSLAANIVDALKESPKLTPDRAIVLEPSPDNYNSPYEDLDNILAQTARTPYHLHTPSRRSIFEPVTPEWSTPCTSMSALILNSPNQTATQSVRLRTQYSSISHSERTSPTKRSWAEASIQDGTDEDIAKAPSTPKRAIASSKSAGKALRRVASAVDARSDFVAAASAGKPYKVKKATSLRSSPVKLIAKQLRYGKRIVNEENSRPPSSSKTARNPDLTHKKKQVTTPSVHKPIGQDKTPGQRSDRKDDKLEEYDPILAKSGAYRKNNQWNPFEQTVDEAISSFEIPALSKKSVVSFAGGSVIRQIPKARSGTFVETDFIVGLRFVVV